ncbi:Glycosylphosphatidylinositol anchor attachment 1 protein [Trichinella zimbabwensis]|uniref:Glycosylphosphatidylinositol anchor attachment 1 protein n=1 Tax=Trichinella zimbabwensis TaxID=268475 RepID=A0A0V1I257_9BILA|nr:Glycosylphosphatidylinositol anchor attachment 1 protein [Trichinella zimbabwensis]
MNSNSPIVRFGCSIIRKSESLSFFSSVVGLIYCLLIPNPLFNEETYTSESALLPGLVDEQLDDSGEIYQMIHEAQKASKTGAGTLSWAVERFRSFGLDVYSHHFAVKAEYIGGSGNRTGVTVCATLRTRRGASTESILLGASPESPTAVGLLVAFAKSFSKRNYWAKDIVFLLPQLSHVGMLAWLDAYHLGKVEQFSYDEIAVRSGRIEAALMVNIDRVEPYSHVDIVYHMLNGQLPNLDLINLLVKLIRKHNLRPTIFNQEQRNDYYSSLRTAYYGILEQAAGEPNGLHSVCGRFGIQAVTLRPYYSRTARDFRDSAEALLSVGRVIEGSLRSLNNLQEILHQSFFFYVLPVPDHYISIGMYMPAVLCFAFTLLFKVAAIWVSFNGADSGEKLGPTEAEQPAWLSSLKSGAHLLFIPPAVGCLLLCLPKLLVGRVNDVPNFVFLCFLASHLLLHFLGSKIPDQWRVDDFFKIYHMIVLIEYALLICACSLLNFGLGLIYCLLVVPVVTRLNPSNGQPIHLTGKVLCLMLIHPIYLYILMQIGRWQAEPTDMKEIILRAISSYMLLDNWSFAILMIMLSLWINAALLIRM